MTTKSSMTARAVLYQLQSMQSYRSQNQKQVVFCNPWNSMAMNFGQMNDRLLGGIMLDKYSRMRDQMEARANYEREAKEFDSEFNSALGQLKAASSALKSYSRSSVFHPMGYGSSNSDVATVTRNTAMVTDPIHLEVSQTAASTSYSSNALASADNTLQGQHTLKITDADGNITSIDVEFDSEADNKTNLNRMAAAINESNLGITASVSVTDGRSALVFSSDKTGTENAFTAELTGESAARIGLEEKRRAKNAIYTVNGGEQQVSQSNEIELLDGDLGVTLKGTGRTDLVHKTVDDAQTLEAVKKFAESYNNVLSFVNKYKDQSKSMGSIAFSYGSSRLLSGTLSQIGVNADSKGFLSVDEGRFRNALRNNRGDVERLLGGSEGLAYQTYARTESISIMQRSKSFYPKPPSLTNSNYMYGNNRKYVNPYMSGMLFSNMI